MNSQYLGGNRNKKREFVKADSFNIRNFAKRSNLPTGVTSSGGGLGAAQPSQSYVAGSALTTGKERSKKLQLGTQNMRGIADITAIPTIQLAESAPQMKDAPMHSGSGYKG